MPLNVEIICPSKKLMTGLAEQVVAPSVQGEVGILPQHTNYVTELKAGRLIIVKSDAGQEEYSITGGLMTVSADTVKVLVDGLSE